MKTKRRTPSGIKLRVDYSEILQALSQLQTSLVRLKNPPKAFVDKLRKMLDKPENLVRLENVTGALDEGILTIFLRPSPCLITVIKMCQSIES